METDCVTKRPVSHCMIDSLSLSLSHTHSLCTSINPSNGVQVDSPGLNTADFLNVVLAGGLVRSLEEAGGVFAEPLG